MSCALISVTRVYECDHCDDQCTIYCIKRKKYAISENVDVSAGPLHSIIHKLVARKVCLSFV